MYLLLIFILLTLFRDYYYFNNIVVLLSCVFVRGCVREVHTHTPPSTPTPPEPPLLPTPIACSEEWGESVSAVAPRLLPCLRRPVGSSLEVDLTVPAGLPVWEEEEELEGETLHTPSTPPPPLI